MIHDTANLYSGMFSVKGKQSNSVLCHSTPELAEMQLRRRLAKLAYLPDSDDENKGIVGEYAGDALSTGLYLLDGDLRGMDRHLEWIKKQREVREKDHVYSDHD